MIAGPGPTTGNMTALNQTVSILCNQFAQVSIQLTGTWAGTVTFEGSVDGGTTWWTIAPVSLASTARTTGVATSTANGAWVADATALTNVRVRFSTFTSGTVVARLDTAFLTKD